MTHAFRRDGSTDLFAAMNVATGKVFYDTKTRQRNKEVLTFFKFIDLHVPGKSTFTCSTTSPRKAEPITTWLAHPKRVRSHTSTARRPVRHGSTWSRVNSLNSLTDD